MCLSTDIHHVSSNYELKTHAAMGYVIESVDINKPHVNIIMLHVDINKSHVHIIMLHVDIKSDM